MQYTLTQYDMQMMQLTVKTVNSPYNGELDCIIVYIITCTVTFLCPLYLLCQRQAGSTMLLA